MGKRIIQQARGKGSLTYRVRKKAFRFKIAYPHKFEGEAEIINLLHSPAHSAPLLKLKTKDQSFYLPAFNGAVVGQKIQFGEKSKATVGNVLPLKKIPNATPIYNIEKSPKDGGKMMRAAGCSTTISKKLEHNKVVLQMSKKKEIILSGDCRATIGVVAGDGRTLKPFFTAGKKYHKMKAKSKLWPKISAVSVNAVDHPFGSGRGKRVKSKIAKRNAPPGKRVGHLRPKKTGYKR